MQDAALALLDGMLGLLKELWDGHDGAAGDDDLIADDAAEGTPPLDRGPVLGDAAFEGGPTPGFAEGTVDAGVAAFARRVTNDEVVVVLSSREYLPTAREL